MKAPRLISGFLTVGFWTLASRILGFARDIMLASFLGTGPVAEAFLVAFSLPNVFRRFFAEGAFNMAFVPMFSKKLEAGDAPDEFARDAMSGLAGALIVLTGIAMVTMPWLVWAMAAGFTGDERFALAETYGRITFPYILFISLAALLSGVLNALGRFSAAAAAPVLLNIFFVVAMIAADKLGWNMGITLAWTVPVAGIAQMALVWVAASRAGFRLIPRLPRMTPDLKRLMIIAVPAALAGGVVQINLLVGRQIASQVDGAVAWLNYADRLYQLPLGVVGIAVGIVLLPELSRRLQAQDATGGQEALSRAAEISLALTIPAAVALIVVSTPLISVMFERGAFDSDDTANTAVAVAIYGMGLPAFVLQKVLQPLYYAREDTRTPFRFALVAMVVNAVVAVGLLGVVGFWAAAVGTTISAWAMVGMLMRGRRKMGSEARFDAQLRRRLWRICVASAVMGAILMGFNAMFGQLFFEPGFKFLALAAMIAVGMASYFIIGHKLHAFRMGEFKAAMRRG